MFWFKQFNLLLLQGFMAEGIGRQDSQGWEGGRNVAHPLKLAGIQFKVIE
jgi:hypothetical protein